MHFAELWSFHEDTLVEFHEDAAVVNTRWGEIRLPRPCAALRTALERMSLGPVSLGNAEYDGAGLDVLEHVIVRSLATADGIPLLSVVPLSSRARFRAAIPEPDMVHRLSRFAQLRVVGDRLRVESPLSAHRVELHRTEAFLLVSCFGSPSSVKDAATRLRLPVELTRAVIGYLATARLIVSGPPGAPFAEDQDPALVSWSPHDLMLHSRSRLGRHDDPYGATFRFAGKLDPEPPFKGDAGRQATPLPCPRPRDDDPTIMTVLDNRRSVRRFGERPLTLSEIGELLYRSARVRDLLPPAPGDPTATPRSSRPYPSIGGTYGLELYVTAANCTGLARDMYHYDPLSHAVRAIDVPKDALDQLLQEARIWAGLTAEPPALIVVTARFQRVTWQYESLAYSALLKDVGALFQTMYLVCTAMQLGSCALAAGDSDLSAEALGLDWQRESSVGEFVVGPLPRTTSPMG